MIFLVDHNLERHTEVLLGNIAIAFNLELSNSPNLAIRANCHLAKQ
jgi:hypothetical protein